MSASAPGPLAPLVAFGRDLRERGLPVGTGRILTFARAVAAIGLTDRESLYWAGRTTMIGRKEDFAAYDEAFADWYAGLITQGELRVEINLPKPGAKRQVDWGEQPDDLEVTLGRSRRSGARPATTSPRTTTRRRSGSWRAAWRSCARSRSPT
jgi:uncharacterized protein with von Willebrand factor type A (vWA) domain